jgi:LPS-assembly lipoprotein
MSWSSVSLIAGLALLLAGCGFHPLYGEQDGGKAVLPELASISVDSIPDRSGQELTNELRDVFNPRGLTVPARYRLQIGLTKHTQNLMTRPNTSASRTDLSMTASWALTRLSDKKIVLQGSAKATTGHDVLTNEYANVVGDNTDMAAAVSEVSDQIQEDLALYFRNPK